MTRVSSFSFRGGEVGPLGPRRRHWRRRRRRHRRRQDEDGETNDGRGFGLLLSRVISFFISMKRRHFFCCLQKYNLHLKEGEHVQLSRLHSPPDDSL